MPMNVQPAANLPDRINEIRMLTAEIVNREILPNGNRLWAWRRDGYAESDRHKARQLRHEIQAKVKMGTARIDHNICYSWNGASCGVCARACPFEGTALVIGLYFSMLEYRSNEADYAKFLKVIHWHKTFGVLVFVLVFYRLYHRWKNPPPELPAGNPLSS